MNVTEATVTGDELVSWAEPNTVALNDPRVEEKALASLGCTIHDADLAMGVPLVRSANPDYPAVPLLSAVIAGEAFAPAAHPYRRCDLCTDSGEVRDVSKLVVPMGGSVVLFRLCLDCHCDLSLDFPDLVWI